MSTGLYCLIDRSRTDLRVVDRPGCENEHVCLDFEAVARDEVVDVQTLDLGVRRVAHDTLTRDRGEEIKALIRGVRVRPVLEVEHGVRRAPLDEGRAPARRRERDLLEVALTFVFFRELVEHEVVADRLLELVRPGLEVRLGLGVQPVPLGVVSVLVVLHEQRSLLAVEAGCRACP